MPPPTRWKFNGQPFWKTLGAGLGLASIGLALAAAVCGQVAVVWLFITAAVFVADLLALGACVVAFGRGVERPARGWLTSQFTLFALAILAVGWDAFGAGGGVGAGLAITAVVIGTLGLVFRRSVLTAFVDPTSSRLGLVLGALPILGAGGGGSGYLIGRSGHGVVGIVMSLVGFYLLLFSMAGWQVVLVPGWKAPRKRPARRAAERG